MTSIKAHSFRDRMGARRLMRSVKWSFIHTAFVKFEQRKGAEMDIQNKIDECLASYQSLCRIIDQQFELALKSYGWQMNCRKGCDQCCTLTSVMPLEAHAIKNYLTQQSWPWREQIAAGGDKQCIFLHRHECLIYPVRPLICRSHGLFLRMDPNTIVPSCSRNFNTGQGQLEHRMLFDNQWATLQLAKLNLAFTVLRNESDQAERRVALSEIKDSITSSPMARDQAAG